MGQKQVGRPDALTNGQEEKAAMASHLAYSAGFGALYGAVGRRADGVPAPLAGALFGLAAWKLSFDGWMPALGIMPATTDLPMKKWAPDLLSHVVYGAATALAYEAAEAVLH